MILADLAKRWSSGIWKYLRPTELLRGVVDGCRVSWNSLSKLHDLMSVGRVPVGTGSGMQVLSVSLNNIGKNVVVAGSGVATDKTAVSSLVAGTPGYLASTYPYKLTGAPSGILYFCRSLSTVGASRYHDFIEYAGTYYFRKDPTSFGVVSTRSGAICSFIIFDASTKSTGFQDITNTYNGSTSYHINKAIHEFDTRSGASNGFSEELLLSAAGSDMLREDETVVRTWVEGGVLLACTSLGRLIRDMCAGTEHSLSQGLAPGMPLTNSVYRGAVYVDSTGSWAFTSDPDKVQALKDSGVISIDTTSSMLDGNSSVAISSRINNISTHVLYRLVELTAYTPGNDYDMIYAYFSSSAKDGAPEIFPGMHPVSAVIGNQDSYTVLRIPKSSENNFVSLGGETYGATLRSNMLLKAVSFVQSGNSLKNDVIVKHVQLPDTVCGAGNCIVFVT